MSLYVSDNKINKDKVKCWCMEQKFYIKSNRPEELLDNKIIALGFDTTINLKDAIDNNIDIKKYIDDNCENASYIKIFSKIKRGDFILYRAYRHNNKDKIESINYIGEVLDDFYTGYRLDSQYGHSLPTKWIYSNIEELYEEVYTNYLYKLNEKNIKSKLIDISLDNDSIDKILNSKQDKYYLENYFYKNINNSIKNNELLLSIDMKNLDIVKNIKKEDYILFKNKENIEGKVNCSNILVNGVCKVKEDFIKENIINNSYRFNVEYIEYTNEQEENFLSITDFKLNKKPRYTSKHILNRSLNMILYGPPGTGKTYSISREVIHIFNYLWYIDSCQNDGNKIQLEKSAIKLMLKEEYIKFCTFHQSYGYEDFIEGLKSDGNGNFKPEDGILKDIAIEALYNGIKFEKKIDIEIKKDTLTKTDIKKLKKKLVLENIHNQDSFDFDKSFNYVLVIDEINRGNISKIFGELITLLEEDKRLTKNNQMIVKLPYSKEDFCLPPNLYIIGTMNTSDKSIALMDIALRRRFEFKEMMPDPSLLTTVDDIDLPKMLDTINKRIEFLYDRDYMIGHAYLINSKNIEEISKVFKNKIIPLLQEYFYDDWEKIGLILGGIGKGKKDNYIVYKEEIRASDLFKDSSIFNKYGNKTKYYIKDDISIEELKNIYE